jgi:hypothetical protein
MNPEKEQPEWYVRSRQYKFGVINIITLGSGPGLPTQQESGRTCDCNIEQERDNRSQSGLRHLYCKSLDAIIQAHR